MNWEKGERKMKFIPVPYSQERFLAGNEANSLSNSFDDKFF